MRLETSRLRVGTMEIVETPPTVRLEDDGRDAHGYRDAADDRRRIVRVRGTSPRSAHLWLAGLSTLAVAFAHAAAWDVSSYAPLLGIASFFLFVAFLALAPTVLWRRVQWTELEITRRTLTVRSGPMGGRVAVEAWSARAPVATLRESAGPFVRFQRWDLHAEREDGRRTHLATLHDEEAVRFVKAFLADAFREAEPTGARHPFAARFGPMPEAMSCEGDVEDPRSQWRVEVRCARGNLALELAAAVGLAILALPLALLTAVVAVSGGWGGGREGGSMLGPTVLLFGLTAALGVAIWSQARIALMRWRGRVHVELDATGIDIQTTPWRAQVLAPRDRRPPGRVSLRVIAHPGHHGEAQIDVVRGPETRRLRVPIGIDEARYLERIVTAYSQRQDA